MIITCCTRDYPLFNSIELYSTLFDISLYSISKNIPWCHAFRSDIFRKKLSEKWDTSTVFYTDANHWRKQGSGASIPPWDHDAFSPCFRDFPLISEKFSDFLKFRENYSSPLLLQFPPVLGKFTCFLHTLRVFFPLLCPWCIYASPNARTGRDVNKDLTPKDQDKDKDLTPKDKDKDRDLIPKDQDKDKDLKYALKDKDEDKDHS